MLNRYPFLSYPTEKIDYVTKQTAHFSITQLINQQPFWENVIFESKPKVLILADWTMRRWGYKKKDEVHHLLTQLIKENFTIYLWQDGTFLKLTLDTLECLYDKEYTLKKITLTHPNDILTEAIKQYKIPKNQLLIVRSHIIDTLLYDLPIDRPLEILAKDIRTYSNKILEICYMNASRHVVIVKEKSVEYDEKNILNKSLQEEIKACKELGYTCNVKVRKTYCMLTEKNCSAILTAKKTGKKSFIYYDADDIPTEVSLEFLKNVTSIYITYNSQKKPIKLSDFVTIYPLFPKLEKIEFYCNFTTADIEIIKNICFKNVIEFKFNRCEFDDFMTFHKILEHNPQLRNLECCSLTFSGVETSSTNSSLIEFKCDSSVPITNDSAIEFKPNVLPVLHQMICDFYEIQHINTLLKAAPRLKRLECEALSGLDFTEIVSSNVEIFLLKKCDKSSILKFVNQFPKLRELNLSCSAKDKAKLDLKSIKSSRFLDRLYLEGYNLHEYLSDYIDFLSKIFQIKKIIINTDECYGIQNEQVLQKNKNYPVEIVGSEVLSDDEDELSEDEESQKERKSSDFDQTVSKQEYVKDSKDLLKQSNRNEIEDLIQQSHQNHQQTETKNPHYNTDKYYNYKPRTEYEFELENSTKNHGVIIYKLCRYFILIKKHTEIIPKIINGICMALSMMFRDKYREWNDIIDPILEWNESKEDLEKKKTILEDRFDLIVKYIKKYQLSTLKGDAYFIGNLDVYFKKNNGSHIIGNPWHGIAVVPFNDSKRQAWLMYDPELDSVMLSLSHRNLNQIVTDQLGSLLCVIINENDPLPLIDPIDIKCDSFIKEGGLLILSTVKNVEQINLIGDVNKDSLKGILLRDTGGVPAWAKAIKISRLSAFTLKLLKQFMLSYDDGLIQLQHSLENISPLGQKILADSIRELSSAEFSKLNVPTMDQNFSKGNALLNNLTNILIHNPISLYFDNIAETWKKKKSYSDDTIEDQVKQWINHTPEDKNILIQLPSSDAIENIQIVLQNYCKQSNIPHFYIHSHTDMICSAPWTSRDQKNKGTTHPAPGGMLYDFLQKHMHQPVILVIHCNILADYIIRFYLPLLKEKNPTADGILLPSNTKIIGLMNINDPDIYQGADFMQPFKKKINLSSVPEQSLCLPNLPFVEEIKDKKPFVIDFLDGKNWEKKLLGTWELDGEHLFFREGLLQKAIKKDNLFLLFKNAPWENPKFLYAIRQLYYAGSINYCGSTITLPKKPILMKSTGHHLKKLASRLNTHRGILIENIPVLTPDSSHLFLKQYQIDNETKTLTLKPGWIAACAGKPKKLRSGIKKYPPTSLKINVMRPLADGEWATILKQCNAYNVTLEAYSYYNDPLDQVKKDAKETMFIVSEDPDVAIRRLTLQESWYIIDVTECDGSLFEVIEAKFSFTQSKYSFEKYAGPLKQGLSAGKNFILTGKFSNKFIDQLCPFLLERLSSENPLGKLVLIAKNNPFPFMLSKHDKPSDYAEYKYLLDIERKNLSLSIPTISVDKVGLHNKKDLCYAHFKAYEDYKFIGLTTDPFEGMNSLSIDPMLSKNIIYTDSKEITFQFNQKRLDTVNKVLSISPYVFLSGLSGVGKSTFVRKIFAEKLIKEKTSGRLYQSEAEMKQWALDDKPGRKVLFIDEANIGNAQWTQFKGLMHTPPTILIGKEHYILTPEHKIIFAGNPVNYSDERTLASLFQQHGMSIVFERLPPEYIYETLLKPILIDAIPAELLPKIADLFLELYIFINNCSCTNILISPREMEMLALLFITQAKQVWRDEDYIKHARHLTYELGKTLVPELVLKTFEEKFHLPMEETKAHPQIQLPIPGKQNEFVVTQSRRPIIDLLNNILQLRQYRKQNKNIKNDIIYYGGLGGIILEGGPDTGKTDLVMAYLYNQGYSEACLFPEFKQDLSESKKTDSKKFYNIPVSMDLTEKEALLLRAFHEGAIVFIENINSASISERLLNDLTMGKTPQGELPKNPGFMIIGTQQPISVAGRRKTSDASARRLLTVPVPDYTENELMEIVLNDGINLSQAKYFVSIYQKKLMLARQKHFSPEPTLQTLKSFYDGEYKPIKQNNLKLFNSKRKRKETESPAPESLAHKKIHWDKIHNSFTNCWSTSSSSSSSSSVKSNFGPTSSLST